MAECRSNEEEMETLNLPTNLNETIGSDCQPAIPLVGASKWRNTYFAF